MKEARRNNKTLSVIIAVHNEEKVLARTLAALCGREHCEVIVVDGESRDDSLRIAREFPVKLIKTGKNRARQFNLAAAAARGEILVFLHADCVPEDGALSEIRNAIELGYVGGALSQSIEDKSRIYRLIEHSGNKRAQFFRIFYGDQAIFVRRDIFFALRGFDEVDLFDDVLFSRKLRQAGKTGLLKKRVFTSPRRWQRQGVIRTTLVNWLISLGFIFGISPNILKKAYPEIR